MARPCVFGIGNPSRRDDGVGVWVAQALAARLDDRADVRVLGDDSFELVDALAGARAALLVDAVQSGAAPGTVHRFDALAGPLPAALLRCSTHLLGVAEAVELARALGQLPARLQVYGIEGADFGIGEGLSPPVAAAAAALVDELAGC
ncbi:MAG: hydrogenase maturation protease [Pseudomonadota bacterium]